MTSSELKKEISKKVGFPVRVKDNGSYFSISISKLDGTQSFDPFKDWLNTNFISEDKTLPVFIDCTSAYISKESFIS